MPRDDYYFQYGDADFKAIMADLANATDPAKRTELMQAAQKKIAGRLCQRLPVSSLAAPASISAKLKGIWLNAPTQANDMTGVYWEE